MPNEYQACLGSVGRRATLGDDGSTAASVRHWIAGLGCGSVTYSGIRYAVPFFAGVLPGRLGPLNVDVVGPPPVQLKSFAASRACSLQVCFR